MVLYYFSATGNTLTTARMLQAELGPDCRLEPMVPLYGKDKITISDEAVGFVYPVYNGDMPWLVRSVAAHMEFAPGAYIFSVCTIRGWAGAVASRLEDVLRRGGYRLSLHRSILMPGNSRESTAEEIADALAKQPGRVKALAEELRHRPQEDYTPAQPLKDSPFTNGPCNPRGIAANEKCIGCGTCVKVCPMDNIRLVNGKAVIGDSCLTCLACFHWCPQEAIHQTKAEPDGQRRPTYRHPLVSFPDILSQKQL